MYPLAFEILE
uniref:Uncharacterized protein n=1 Tax=Lepeophtheirus salmonis TaxID=72036 RepID=A0A0K2TUA6_LEPSM